MTIVQATPPNLIGEPNVPLLEQNRFDAVIWNKGYDIILEQAIACPCRGKSGSAKPTCKNCLGVGFVFVNPIQTRAIITSINKDTKFKAWSPELTGTISVTVRDSERLSFFDKITFPTRTSIMSEVRMLASNAGDYFAFTSYKIKSINAIFMFNGDGNKLVKVDPALYSIKDNRNIIDFDETLELPSPFNGVISVDYEHEVSYNIVDLPHDFRSAFVMNNNGVNEEHNLPIQGIAKRSHILLNESMKYDGSGFLNNNF